MRAQGRARRTILAGLVAASLAACGGGAAPSPAPSVVPVASAAPTVAPTARPHPTDTPAPSPTAGGPAAAPLLAGDDLPDELLGTYYDRGEPSVGWHFLGAGDPFCVEQVLTRQSCLEITRVGVHAPADFGPLVRDGAVLVLVLLHDEFGACLLEEFRIPYELTEAGLLLKVYGCLSGSPRDLLVRGQPH